MSRSRVLASAPTLFFVGTGLTFGAHACDAAGRDIDGTLRLVYLRH
jgi:hypothetical protein